MADQNIDNGEDESPPHLPHCDCLNDQSRAKELNLTITNNIANILNSHPHFSSFIEVQLLAFQHEIRLFTRRLFEAENRRAIKVLFPKTFFLD